MALRIPWPWIVIGQEAKPDPWTTMEGAEAAIAYCRDEIGFYDGVFGYNHSRWKTWQGIAIVSGVIGTLAAAITVPPNFVNVYGVHLGGWLRAVPVAIASVATGLMGSFAYQSEAFRQGMTADALRGELVKFIAGGAPYDASEAGANVSRFLINIRAIISGEQGAWISQSVLASSSVEKTKGETKSSTDQISLGKRPPGGAAGNFAKRDPHSPPASETDQNE